MPRTRQEVVKTRVPTYRDEPRYADAFSYKTWSWAHDRTVRKQGVVGDVADDVEAGGHKWPWPAGARTSSLPPGEQEREKRTARYFVTLVYDRDSMLRFEVKSPEALAPFTPGSKHRLRIEQGSYIVNASEVTPLNIR